MATIPTLVTGDDTIIPVQITRDFIDEVIAGTATVKASIITKNKRNILIAAVPVVEGTTGSSWATGLVVVALTSAQTGAIPASRMGSAYLEVQVNDGGITTWFTSIKLVQGTIDQ